MTSNGLLTPEELSAIKRGTANMARFEKELAEDDELPDE
jgi:hypothetical protein